MVPEPAHEERNMSAKKILVISCNPDPLCIAAEVVLIRNRRGNATVSALNLNQAIGSVSEANTVRDKLYEFIDRKYTRFIVPEINGRDLTKSFAQDAVKIPALPLSIDMVRKHKIADVNLGLAALSSAASLSRCTSERSCDYGFSLQRAWRIAHLSYYAALKLTTLNFDEVFIFNGRHAISRPIVEVLECKAKFTYYEFDPQRQCYLLFDKKIHLPETLADLIKNHLYNYDAAEEFFVSAINRKLGTDSAKFTSNQKVGLLPQGLGGQEVISFFSSSPDEFFAITDDARISDDFSDQFDVALFCAQECRRAEKKLVIRLHPHLLKKHPSWREEWNFSVLQDLDATIIYPEDKVDSYALISRSSGVITCGSTIGIEAAYQSVPSAVVGNFLSVHIGCAMNASARQDLAGFISCPQVEVGAKEHALLYGSYIASTRGNEIVGLTMRGGHYYFEEKNISPSRQFTSRLKALMVRPVGRLSKYF